MPTPCGALMDGLTASALRPTATSSTSTPRPTRSSGNGTSEFGSVRKRPRTRSRSATASITPQRTCVENSRREGKRRSRRSLRPRSRRALRLRGQESEGLLLHGECHRGGAGTLAGRLAALIKTTGSPGSPKRRDKVVAATALTGAAVVCLYLLALAFPEPLFAYSLAHENFRVYSRHPVDPGVRGILDEVNRRRDGRAGRRRRPARVPNPKRELFKGTSQTRRCPEPAGTPC